MKPIHLLSLLGAYRDLSPHAFEQYIRQFSMDKMRDNELDDLQALVTLLHAEEEAPLHQFFVSYRIKQISKEFDLLRIGRNFIMNIELKKESTIERMTKQLLQNVYYLKFLELEIYSFTYVSSTNTLYQLKDGVMEEVDARALIALLKKQQVRRLTNIDDLFDPINYLVSPFESPHAFMNGEYFLTSPQMTFKREILTLVENHYTVVIDGAPGTGKTLLTYDLVKTWLKEGKKIALIHGKSLTQGQRILNEQYHWQIETFDELNFEEADIVVIDEAQKLTHAQLQKLRMLLQEKNMPAVFSLDAGFYLFGKGARIDVLGYIEKYFEPTVYELKTVMRYNKEMHIFAQQLFDQRHHAIGQEFPNITVQYFSTEKAAASYIDDCRQTNWLIVDCHHFERLITRDILGQEFNRVCIILNHQFIYKGNGRISAVRGKAAVDPLKVLYHTIVRTRKKLQLVIIGNIPMLHYILQLLQKENH